MPHLSSSDSPRGSDSLRSYGGQAGEAVVIEDLEHAAATLLHAAWLIEDAGVGLSEAEGHVSRAYYDGEPATRAAAARASDALRLAHYGTHGTGPTADAACDSADRLTRVANAFLDAEQAAMSHVSAMTRVRVAAGSMWSTAWWAARHQLATVVMGAAGPFQGTAPMKAAIEKIRPDGLPPTTGFINRDTMHALTAGMDSSVAGYNLQVYALAAAVASLEGLFNEGRATSVIERERSYPPRSPLGVMNLMQGILDQQERFDGSVSVETITHADGTRSHIVTIPGTEDWTLWDDNPLDAQANADGVVGRSSDAQRAVIEAMREAGIEPGDDVMLAGHSQGGINAVALASNTEFLAEFNVTHVVTAGSPVGRMALPDSIKALHLEHSEDIVAGLDAVKNPPTASRTTVERDLMLSGDEHAEQLGRDVAGAHHLEAYASTAALIDGGKAGTSAAMWKASAASFFSGDPSTLKEFIPVVPPASVTSQTGSRPSETKGIPSQLPERWPAPRTSGLKTPMNNPFAPPG